MVNGNIKTTVSYVFINKIVARALLGLLAAFLWFS